LNLFTRQSDEVLHRRASHAGMAAFEIKTQRIAEATRDRDRYPRGSKPWNHHDHEIFRLQNGIRSDIATASAPASAPAKAGLTSPGGGSFGGLVASTPGHFGQGSPGMLRTANGWALHSTGNWSY